MDDEERDDRKAEIRHTITAEETFTLAKDVFDIRCFIKNVYNNRAVIKRRINLFSLSVSIAFTLLYLAYVFYVSLTRALSLNIEIALYVLLGVYAVIAILLIVFTCVFAGSNTSNVRKISYVIHICRMIARVLSLAIAITAIALNFSSVVTSPSIVFNVFIIVMSVISLIVQAILLIAGGISGFARWLLSPVKVKKRFSFVVLEWYELAVSDSSPQGDGKKVKRVNNKYLDDVANCIDEYILPELGKRKITSIKPVTVLNVVDSAPENEREVVGGTLRSVFAYAEDCGYVNFNPCRSLDLGNIEEEVKEKRTLKQRIFGIGKRFVKKRLDKYINDSVENGGDAK